MPRAYPCCNGRFKRLSSTWTARSSTTKARAKQKGICKGTVLTGASHEALEAPLLRRDKALSWDRRTVCAWSCRYVESCRNFGVGCGLREQDLHGKIVGTKQRIGHEDSAGTRKAQAEAEAQTAHLHLGFEDVSMDPGALSPEVYVQETPFDFRRFSLLVLSDSWNQEEYLEEIKAGPRFGTQH